jgi:hypothetical protein
VNIESVMAIVTTVVILIITVTLKKKKKNLRYRVLTVVNMKMRN